MASSDRRNQRRVWLVIGGLGVVLIAIELAAQSDYIVKFAISLPALAAVVLASYRYRALTSRSRKVSGD